MFSKSTKPSKPLPAYKDPTSPAYIDPRDPKNSYAMIAAKRAETEREQDDRMNEAYASGKLKRHKEIPGVISHNDALYFAGASGWTHAERWRPDEEAERERTRRESEARGKDGYSELGAGVWEGDGEGKGRKKSVSDRVKRVFFGGMRS